MTVIKRNKLENPLKYYGKDYVLCNAFCHPVKEAKLKEAQGIKCLNVVIGALTYLYAAKSK